MVVSPERDYRILIVDDDQMNLKLLRIVLEAKGYFVIEASDGQEALEKLEPAGSDLVISDILMPNMDGYRLCYEMRRHPRFRSIPLIFYTATFTSPSDEDLAAMVGGNHYLRKPTPTAELLGTVAKLVGQKVSPPPKVESLPPALDFRQQYSETLVRKVEDKNRELSERTSALEESERDLARSQEALRAMAARLDSAREDEALRISRELHDELGQSLTALSIDIGCLQSELSSAGESAPGSAVGKRLEAMSRLLTETIISVQRIASDLRPPILDDLGLSSTLEWQAEEFAARTGITCSWKEQIATPRLAKEKAVAFFRIFREALTNISRHATATRIELSLAVTGEELVLTVTDNGVGFDTERSKDRESLGLLGMQERAFIMKGKVQITSGPGHGTTVRVSIPLSKGEP